MNCCYKEMLPLAASAMPLPPAVAWAIRDGAMQARWPPWLPPLFE